MNSHPDPKIIKFWSQVEKTESCWHWLGTKSPDGYGLYYGIKGEIFAHRIAYKMFYIIPKTKPELDHKCFVRNCVNPNHMLPTTHSGNMKNRHITGKRQTYIFQDNKDVFRIQKNFCIHGHKIRGATLDVLTDGRVVCSICNKSRKTKKIKKIIIKNNEMTISDFCKHGERLFGTTWKSAIKTKMYEAGHNVFSKRMTQALRYLEKYDIPLDVFAANYNLTEPKTNLRKKPFEESKP